MTALDASHVILYDNASPLKGLLTFSAIEDNYKMLVNPIALNNNWQYGNGFYRANDGDGAIDLFGGVATKEELYPTIAGMNNFGICQSVEEFITSYSELLNSSPLKLVILFSKSSSGFSYRIFDAGKLVITEEFCND